MEKSCSLHNNPVIAICLFKSCERSLLCLKCLRDHDENHDSLTYNVYDLMNKENWVETYEKQRDDLISKEKEISSQKAQVVSKSQELFKLMLDPVTKAAEEQKERLLEELKEMIDAEKHQEVKELFSKLEGDIEKLEKINFRDGDHFEKISQVKAFNESTMLNTIDVIRQAEDTLQGWVIDEGKLKMYKEELTELLQSIHLKDLLSSTPFKSLKETDTFFALRMTNEQLEEQLKTRAEQSEKSVQVKTQLENDEIPKQMAKDYLEKDELKAQNSQLTEIITSLRANIEEMNEKNEELKNQNAILNREVNQLVEELRPIRRRSNMHLHSQSMADISIASISSNGLFG